MPSTLKQLQDLQRKLVNKQIDASTQRQLVVNDIDGRRVSLNDPDILAVVARRIAAEQARSSEGGVDTAPVG